MEGAGVGLLGVAVVDVRLGWLHAGWLRDASPSRTALQTLLLRCVRHAGVVCGMGRWGWGVGASAAH